MQFFIQSSFYSIVDLVFKEKSHLVLNRIVIFLFCFKLISCQKKDALSATKRVDFLQSRSTNIKTKQDLRKDDFWTVIGEKKQNSYFWFCLDFYFLKKGTNIKIFQE